MVFDNNRRRRRLLAQAEVSCCWSSMAETAREITVIGKVDFIIPSGHRAMYIIVR